MKIKNSELSSQVMVKQSFLSSTSMSLIAESLLFRMAKIMSLKSFLVM